MRKIKFRAWQKTPSLHRQPGMYMVQVLIFYGGEGGGGEAFLNKYGEEARSSEFFDDIELMQYTGLKDKNGVEIYEGDILAYTDLGEVKSKFRGEAPNSNWGGIVEYINDGEGVGTIGRFGVKGLMYKPQVCEVIGNKYENPGLLK